ncbi:GntR family transcriptional regulator [Antricoccus suffuscus]|uniref:GntR family transcriptional regulator n=1 Tax=Antricoccus suffuscus TaxID=1629062 RepID=A0A2T0ZY21_9ACTN|nr:GntR family transcriptional regulator [Antricoccus suffuscus]PRZ40978.1 GntR family transcriptional regulator [Antricoccus suffuscus]
MIYTSKADMVTAKLREMIISGEIRSSAALRQRDLAIQFGVSQTPVREALRRLESEGIVVNDPHKGSTVVEASAGLWNENFAIRAALESLAAELACESITDTQIDELARIDKKMRELGEINDEYRDLNQQFHFGICGAARSPMLMSFIRLLWNALGDGPHVVRSHRESARQHAKILKALRARDKDTIGSLLRVHILGAAIDQE